MKKLLLLLIIVFTINSCCKKEADCKPNCPLSDGTHCSSKMINVNDSCVCKDAYVQYHTRCLDSASLKKSYIVDLDCQCYDDILFSIGKSTNNHGLFNCELYKKDGTFVIKNFSYVGTKTNFIATSYHLDCDLTDDKKIYVEFVGNEIGDTLYLDLIFRVQGPNWAIPEDTCSYAIPKNVL